MIETTRYLADQRNSADEQYGSNGVLDARYGARQNEAFVWEGDNMEANFTGEDDFERMNGGYGPHDNSAMDKEDWMNEGSSRNAMDDEDWINESSFRNAMEDDPDQTMGVSFHEEFQDNENTFEHRHLTTSRAAFSGGRQESYSSHNAPDPQQRARFHDEPHDQGPLSQVRHPREKRAVSVINLLTLATNLR